MSSLVTPIKVNEFIKELKSSGYESKKVDFFEKGLTNGFSVSYCRPKIRQSRSKNIPLQVGSKTELWNKIIKEVKLKRVAGPYDEIPFDDFIQSSVGLVPKAGNFGKTHLIFHLSYNFGKGTNKSDDSEQSVNYHMPREDCSVKYNDIDCAVRYCLQTREEEQEKRKIEGEHDQDKPIIVFMGKTDVQSAFRILPMSRCSWPWLIMMAENPKTGKMQYFVDNCLPFGASISCAIFQKFSDALKFMIQHREKVHNKVSNYLDDFLFLAALMEQCNKLIDSFLSMCQEFGIPIALEKTEWPSARIVFLGILMDGEFMILAIPQEKRDRAINMLREFITKKKATVKDLQKLCGFLNFLNKAIVPGRAFTRRMYAKYSANCKSSSHKFDEPTNKFAKLKAHHHVRLDGEFKADCKVWLEFLTDNDFRKIVNRPMIDLSLNRTSEEIKFYSDASPAENLGYGCILNKHWVYGQWEPNFIKSCKPSIEFLRALHTLHRNIHLV